MGLPVSVVVYPHPDDHNHTDTPGLNPTILSLKFKTNDRHFIPGRPDGCQQINFSFHDF